MTPAKECPFCHPETDKRQHIVFETGACSFLQHDGEQGVLEGSGVIVPKVHRENVFALSEEEWRDTFQLLHLAKAHLDSRFRPDGYTLGWNVGTVSNQTIAHAHFHVVPRYLDEPYAGKGLRHWIKQPENRRPPSGPDGP